MPHLTRRHFFQGAAWQPPPPASGRERSDPSASSASAAAARPTSETTPRSRNADVGALCDVNQAARERAQGRRLATKAKRVRRHARAVRATRTWTPSRSPRPNHWHALATIWACQAGKDVYVREARQLQRSRGLAHGGGGAADQAHGAGRLAEPQHAAQDDPGHATAPRRGDRQGLHGERPVLQAPQVHRQDAGRARPRRHRLGLFLGPAPMRPFTKNRFAYNWHWFWDTGNGDIGNQGVHEMDIARWGLGESGCRNRWSRPAASTSTTTTRRRPTRSSRPSTTATARSCSKCAASHRAGSRAAGEGRQRHRQPVPRCAKAGCGWTAAVSRCTRANRTSWRWRKKRRAADGTTATWRTSSSACRSRNNSRAQCRSRDRRASPPPCATSPTSATVSAEGWTWDDTAKRFVNDAEANKLLTRDYRKPYVVA